MLASTRPLAALLLLGFALGVSQPAMADGFIPYEGKDAIQEGTGGSRKTVDGVDIWTNGAPPRRFLVIGFIEDTRRASGLFGAVRLATLEGNMAKIAAKQGADAIILVDSGDEVVGTYSQNSQNVSGSATTSGNTTTMRGSGYGNSSSVAVKDRRSRYVVVKYLPDDPETRSTPDATGPGTTPNGPAATAPTPAAGPE